MLQIKHGSLDREYLVERASNQSQLYQINISSNQKPARQRALKNSFPSEFILNWNSDSSKPHILAVF